MLLERYLHLMAVISCEFRHTKMLHGISIQSSSVRLSRLDSCLAILSVRRKETGPLKVIALHAWVIQFRRA